MLDNCRWQTAHFQCLRSHTQKQQQLKFLASRWLSGLPKTPSVRFVRHSLASISYTQGFNSVDPGRLSGIPNGQAKRVAPRPGNAPSLHKHRLAVVHKVDRLCLTTSMARSTKTQKQQQLKFLASRSRSGPPKTHTVHSARLLHRNVT